jgi:hypothetical protein
MSTLKLLETAPEVHCRKEAVDVPELGGSVIVRGLLASELFAVSVYRQQALARAMRERRAAKDGADAPMLTLDFDELLAYGQYVCHMLAHAVSIANGLQLYSAEEWETAGQAYPGLLDRLQAIVERLSGMNTEDVQKN